MKMMFVWERVSEGLTDNYHDGGGVLVISDNFDTAQELLKSNVRSLECEVFTQKPSYVTSVTAEDDCVMIFPDAGCC